MGGWTQWPSRQALSREGVPRIRLLINGGMWLGLTGWLLVNVLRNDAFHGWGRAAVIAALAGCAALVYALRRVTLDHRLGPALGLLALLIAAGAALYALGVETPAAAVWVVSAVLAMERLPLPSAVGCAAVALGAYALTDGGSPLSEAITVAAVGLGGYALRLDEEARGTAYRLLEQERAARRAEAESAALAERSRIAREIHDVLAHSLSAQLVHLEAARLLIERGEDSAKVLDRVVAARGMARDGLAETRQALSALRGEMAPVEDFLRESAAAQGARFARLGEPRTLTAEAGLTLRRVAQEALTNVRKHAPGARVELRLGYAEDAVSLEVRDSGARKAPAAAGLTASGAGYGLLGMRERAELLGGTLDAGPEGEGFVVRLRVPL
ncbi:sensor histidine kinase [Streptomyces sp. NPDC021212]|uniref:sensor histidine kinase n=1 Tax=Streptomyces sp. NPDC021212 TaxID=3365118 RepID=UPI0037B17071